MNFLLSEHEHSGTTNAPTLEEKLYTIRSLVDRIISSYVKTEVCDTIAESEIVKTVYKTLNDQKIRDKTIDREVFRDPAWQMLLELFLSHLERRRVSVTSLCIASGVPLTSALRWVKTLENRGLVTRTADDSDRRRTFVDLSDTGLKRMTDYFVQLMRSNG